MRILLKLASVFILTAALAVSTALIPFKAEAMPEIMPLDKIQSGMSGVAYSVVDGSGIIQPFNVEIIGLMDNGKGSAKMIMAKASGAVIDKTGGVLQGMSGSPIYIDGKLVGALAAGLKEMSPYTFFITPIESMLPMWSMPDPKAGNKYQQVALNTSGVLTADDKENEENDINESTDFVSSEVTDDVVESDQDSSENVDGDDLTIEELDRLSELVDEMLNTQNVSETNDENSNDEIDATDEESENVDESESDATADYNEFIPDTSSDLNDETSEQTALSITGFDDKSFKFLSNEWEMSYTAASSSSDERRNIKYNAVVEPGSPIGVAVVCGDFSVGATGTVTAVEGKKILGFGHSFTHAGNVNFFMTDASVIGSISGEVGTGVKVSNIGNIIGRINQDREAGVAGIIGTFPSVVPITVKINDKALGKSETYNSSIAYNENLVPKLGAAIVYAALSKTSDSLAGSTVDIDFSVKTNAVKSGKLERQNMFYNATDVGQVAVIELMQALSLVCSNTSEESDMFGINVDMTLDNERKTASLVSAVPNKIKVKPGETVNLTVTLQPYRKKTETVIVPYKVPITMKEGPMTLDIHCGAVVPVAQVLANAGLIISTDTKEASKSYDEKIKDFLSAGKNNQLVVEPGAITEPKSEKELKRDIARAKKLQAKAAKSAKSNDKKSASEKDNKVETDYIIDNVIHTVINVDKI